MRNQAGFFGVNTATDPYFPKVTLFMDFNGPNGGTTFSDSSYSNAVFTASNGAVISTTSPQFGSGCLLLNNTGNRINATNAGFALGTGDFTVEFSVNAPAGGGSQAYSRLFQIGPNVTAGGLWIVRDLNTNPMRILVQVYASGSYTTVGVSTLTCPNNAWTHVALTRSAGVFKLFIGGVLDSTVSGVPTNNINQTQLFIGANEGVTEYYIGKLDNIRVTRGVARYTSTFTPPTEAFPRS